MKLWGGRFTQDTNKLVERYTSSIEFDKRLAEVDIIGSIAHARMLGDVNVIPKSDAMCIIGGLESLLQELKCGSLEFRTEDEDIHMNIERLLHQRIGPIAGKLHTARSRNDQVALDMHMYVKHVLGELESAIVQLQSVLVNLAETHLDVVIPGYTHLQRAQPVLLSHHLLAYFWMLERDVLRVRDAQKRTDMMPLGAGALAGTTFQIDRSQVQEELGFSELYQNSLDAVSDRDYLIEYLAIVSVVMMHLSRLSEELILWSSQEFGFVELADAYCTGSSMMPQKKNPDVAELVRGKTGRVYGHLMALLTVMKGLPLAYNKDLQEDKEGVFDAVDTVLPALWLFTDMMRTMTIRKDQIAIEVSRDYSNATDVADYLVGKGVPFREAHSIVGKMVLDCIRSGLPLLDLPLHEYQQYSPKFDEDIYGVITPDAVVNRRLVQGGTARASVEVQLAVARARRTLTP